MDPCISINIITYNRSKYLEQAIQSVFYQDFKNWELIIIDDASTDNTRDLVKKFLSDKRVRYFLVNKQKNISKLRNIALRKSLGKYIAVLDSDDLWFDGKKLSKQFNFLEKNEKIVLVGSGAVIVDKDGKEKNKIIKPINDIDVRKNFLLKNPFFHSSVMYRKKYVLSCGLYNEDINYGEDLELWLRLGKLGLFYNFPNYFIKYREHSDNESVKNTKLAVKNVLKIISKYRKDYKFSRFIFLQKIWQKIKEKF